MYTLAMSPTVFALMKSTTNEDTGVSKHRHVLNTNSLPLFPTLSKEPIFRAG